MDQSIVDSDLHEVFRPSPSSASPVEHVFTVDVEEYFQVSAFDDSVARADWLGLPSRIGRNIDLLLELLGRHGMSGTFFVLGWIVERHPDAIRRIAAAGHEVASHGWWHRRVNTLDRDEFRADIRSSKAILEDVIGQPVRGFRAPNFSIAPDMTWAFDILLEEGYRYDSSLFPFRWPGYCRPAATPRPHFMRLETGQLLEFPLATVEWRGLRLPAAGGGFFRQLPYAVTREAFRQHSAQGISGTFYIHTWEVDRGQPRLSVPWLTKMRHYRGLHATVDRLERLLGEFRFTSVARLIGEGADEGSRNGSGAATEACLPLRPT